MKKISNVIKELIPEGILFVKNDNDLHNCLRFIKNCSNEIFYVCSFFGTLTYPDEMLKWRAKQLFSKSDEIESYIRLIKEEEKIMVEKIEKYKVAYLLPELFIKNYFKGKEYGIIRNTFVPNQLKKQHLNKIIGMLEKWNNFEIGLIRESLNFEFMVSNVATVLGSRYVNEPGIRAIILTGQKVIDGFMKKFREMWNKSIIQKEKVINIFQNSI